MSDVFIEIIAVLQLWTNRDTWSFSNVDCYTADQGLAADRVKSIKDASLLISDKIKSVESVILTVANKRDDFNHWKWTKTAEFKSESCRNLFRNSDHNLSKNPETIHLKIRPCSSKISNCGSSETPAAVHPKLWPAFKWNSGSSSEHLAVVCLKLWPPFVYTSACSLSKIRRQFVRNSSWRFIRISGRQFIQNSDLVCH